MMDKACRNILIVAFVVILAITAFFWGLTSCVKAEEEQVCVPDTITAKHIVCKNDTVIILKSELDTMLAEYNKSIREIERKNSMRVEQKLEAVNTNISIWLAIIAAICTLLPMASAFYQTSLWDHKAEDIESMVKNYKEDLAKTKNDIQKVSDKIESSFKEIDNKTKREEFISSLSILESTIRILCEYQDFQSRNRLALADRSYIDALGKTIGNLSELCIGYSKNHSEHLDVEQKKLVKSSIMMALNSFSKFLMVLETIAPGEQLVHVLSKKDELRVIIRQYANPKESGNSDDNSMIDSQIHYLGIFASQMMDLLNQCLVEDLSKTEKSNG